MSVKLMPVSEIKESTDIIEVNQLLKEDWYLLDSYQSNGKLVYVVALVKKMKARLDERDPDQPFSRMEYEQNVLGGLLLEPTTIEKVSTILSVEDFSIDKHRIIYKAIKNLHDNDSRVGLCTVYEMLSLLDLLDQAGGTKYISMLHGVVPTANNIMYYAQVLSENRLKNETPRDISQQ
ncbi:DnaB domain protein helicase domain protein [Desulfofarcimen acetoxidans DSM 771]|uniref:DnaB domain protein helicase domain protein n=1 Tax=Desulfofarcimen acetoxidans (strain ATCC 49208 / DSM 771 / KCTC 5769 / VKM B-1644 / 5575) TaxID=485916 RepID=C8VZD2_DESAS|nr:DnaB-like helicase N-terminal domain-containing protein [Desulfofarcimen acetoxidans]ACV64877.1 DnaB domain protein helicase domain protein [Desulfofarcimen acetoxidans DSM 771]